MDDRINASGIFQSMEFFKGCPDQISTVYLNTAKRCEMQRKIRNASLYMIARG